MLNETEPGRPQLYVLPQDNPARGGGQVQQVEGPPAADPSPASTSVTDQPAALADGSH